MDSTSASPAPVENDFQWLDAAPLQEPSQSRAHLAALWQTVASDEQRRALRERLLDQFEHLDDVDAAISNLRRFVDASEDPAAQVSNLLVDPALLTALLQLVSMSQTLANRLIADPAALEQLREDRNPTAVRPTLAAELAAQLAEIEQPTRAAVVIRRFLSREIIRIAYSEFIRGLAPEKVGRQLAYISDLILEAGLQFVTGRLAQRRGMPQRPDGTIPELTVIGLGNLGGEEMGYASPMKLVFLYDSIDHKNVWHRDFYVTVVKDLVSLLCGDESRSDGIDIDLREGPRHEVGVLICSFREAIRIYETSGRTWQRLNFVKARVVAGSQPLGKAFLERLQPWIYRQFMSRVELAEIRTLRHKLERRAEQLEGTSGNVARAPGGRDDLELTVQFLQLLHGGQLPSVRCHNTYDAIIALERAGCLTHQESTLLSENYARLCRLQHQLSITFDRRRSNLPADPAARTRLAWQLGIRSEDRRQGDLARFEKLLDDTFDKNRKVINHLMLDAPGEDAEAAVETELLLDPDPDPELVKKTMLGHRLTSPRRAMEDLVSLSSETVPFLSPHRCRHFFSSIAPSLLKEVSRTPDPDATLSTLVKVADSLGAKATLWELLGSHRPTMQLMVRLCATTPYLSQILTDNPGMIDELVDSLLMNRLPSAERLDAHSIELCRGAADIERILHSFKNSSHLTIGVRDMLGKESLEATHQAIGDTAEACLRRMIEHEHQRLAEQFGDPVDEQGNPSEMLALALGKLGGREPNYHSDLDAIFLYSAEGETRRRMGGHRATTTNHLFFNQLTRSVLQRVNQSTASGRLYELDSRLRPGGDDGVLAMTIDDFLKQFQDSTAPLWQRFALCKARAISGSRALRTRTDAAVAEVLAQTQWDTSMAQQIREMRRRMEQTAREENLKRGQGGTVDVEFVAQMLTLRHAADSPAIIRQGTTATLSVLAEHGYLAEEHALALIHGYRTLRRIEASLRLMNTAARHELPHDKEAMNNLAFLMSESDPDMIRTMCTQARQRNRAIFEQVFDAAGS